jgi:clan AA aspartic protease
MGHLYADVTLEAARSTTLRMLVDTGATYSFVSDEVVKTIEAPRLPRRIRVTLADGTLRDCDVALAKIVLEGREAAITLIVGDVAEPLLGVEALEALGLAPDPSSGRHVPTRAAAVVLATLTSAERREAGGRSSE